MIVNTVGPADAKIMFVGEAPGETEDKLGQPFTGNAGKTLNWILSQAGINRHDCLITNVARQRPPGNKISFYFEDKKCTIPKPILKEWILQLQKEIILYKPNLIVALGATALWALTGEKSISRFRGYVLSCSLVPGVKVISTYHPQAINYDWKLHFVTILDFKKIARHAEFPEVPQDKRILLNNVSKAKFIEYCKFLLDRPELKVTVDIENVQPGSHINIIGFAHSPNFAMSTSFIQNKVPICSVVEEHQTWYWIARVLTEKQLIFQNAMHDVSVLYLNHGILCRNIYMDTLIAAHCCFPELPRDLGFITSMLLDVRPWKHTADQNRSLYNAEDCANTHGCAEVLENELRVSGNYETYRMEMSQLFPAIFLQLQGILVDIKRQEELIAESDKIIAETGDLLLKLLGRQINYNSSKQLQKLLYIDLKLPIQYKRRKRATDPRVVTAGKEALKKLARLVPDNPMFQLILQHKKYLKLKNSFLDIKLSPTNRVHTSYNITGSSTDDEGRKSFGRWSSSSSIILPYGSGNLQNIPEEARRMYTVEEGYGIVQADYIQAEAVEVAYLSNDRKLIRTFEESFGKSAKEREAHPEWDVHRLKAADLYGISPFDVTDEQRSVGKTIRHARNYSAGPGVVAAKIGCSMAQAKALLAQDDRANPWLAGWHKQIEQKLMLDRTLVTPLGRKHRFLGRMDDHLLRSAYAYIPQSTVGDLLNRSLVKIYNRHYTLMSILLQLHDAIYVKYKLGTEGAVIKALRECMITVQHIGFETAIVDVDFKMGRYWGDMKKVDWTEYIPEGDSYERRIREAGDSNSLNNIELMGSASQH